MKLGLALRVMGEASRPDTLVTCARAADEAGVDEIFVVDHIAIPPDDAEGSGGRYLDPLATLAFLAAATSSVGIGTSVLILPYRPKLPTAKALATIQELSGNRLSVGVGVGWMKPEFRALGVDRQRRGALTDEVLEFLRRCFDAEDDVVSENGQPFFFRPRPRRPPIFIGGAPPHAFERAVRYADGWMPMTTDPEKLAPQIAELHALAEREGAAKPEVVTLGALPIADPGRAAAQVDALAQLGVTRVITGVPYDADPAPFLAAVEQLAKTREALGADSG